MFPSVASCLARRVADGGRLLPNGPLVPQNAKKKNRTANVPTTPHGKTTPFNTRHSQLTVIKRHEKEDRIRPPKNRTYYGTIHNCAGSQRLQRQRQRYKLLMRWLMRLAFASR